MEYIKDLYFVCCNGKRKGLFSALPIKIERFFFLMASVLTFFISKIASILSRQ